MEDTRELRRMPRGERCPVCGSRKWYLQNGLRFCANGDQIEFDVGDEEDSGKMGAVARREKELRESEKRHLTGAAGKKLYLEALQLMLRNQLLWLIREKGHRAELETVVRDLWDLRLRGSSSLGPEEGTTTDGLAMFSSQPQSEAQSDNESTNLRRKTRAQSWDAARGADWPLPKVPDTLALCYLGCLLLHIPTRIGEFIKWANNGNMPYKLSYYDLPQEMQDRMPSAYTRALKLPIRSNLGDDLYGAVMDLALSYRLNYDLLFPPVEEVLMLIHAAKMLVVPVDSIIIARRLAATLGCSFEFPVDKVKAYALDHPEILLEALLVVATKLAFPFQSTESPLEVRFTPMLNWGVWAKSAIEEQEKLDGDRPDFDRVTAEKVASMDEDELSAYFSHVSSFVDRNNENPITQLFPQENRPSAKPSIPERQEHDMDQLFPELLGKIICVPEDQAQAIEHDDRGRFSSNSYETFRNVEDLSDTAKVFYTTAAHDTGVSLETLVHAVYMLEQRLVVWQKKQTAGSGTGNGSRS